MHMCVCMDVYEGVYIHMCAINLYGICLCTSVWVWKPEMISGVFLCSSPPFYFSTFFFFFNLDLSDSARMPGQWALDAIVSGTQSTGVTEVTHHG